MFHFKHFAIGASLLLALSFLPAPGKASDHDFLFENQTMEDRLDPEGYCDLFWEETLDEVKGEYPVSFIRHDLAYDVYLVDMTKAPGWKFKGPKKVEAWFNDNKLYFVFVNTADTTKEARRILEEMYGKPYVNGKHEKYWIGRKTFMLVGLSGKKKDPSLGSCILYGSVSKVRAYQILSEKEDPRGFDDLYWGNTIEEVKEKHPLQLRTRKNGWVQYMFSIPDVQNGLFLKGPVFGSAKFDDGKLECVEILRKESNPELIAEMKKQYGSPAYIKKDFYMWVGPYTTIAIRPSSYKDMPEFRSVILLVQRSKQHNREKTE